MCVIVYTLSFISCVFLWVLVHSCMCVSLVYFHICTLLSVCYIYLPLCVLHISAALCVFVVVCLSLSVLGTGVYSQAVSDVRADGGGSGEAKPSPAAVQHDV